MVISRIMYALACAGLLFLSPPVLAQGAGGGSTSSGTSRAFNPAISLNGLFLVSAYPDRPGHDAAGTGDGGEGHEHAREESGLDLQEVELRFSAEIDPYSRADATFAVHGEETHFEELVISSRVLGGGFGLRGGKFYVDASSENLLHTHEFPFVRRSLIDRYLFAEPYADVGIELSYLLPLTPYVELKGVLVDGKSGALFQVEDSLATELEGSDLAYNGTLHTLFDLSESSTLGLAGRWLGGRNTLGQSSLSQVASVSMSYRWVPTRTNRYKGLRLHGEYVWSKREADAPELSLENNGWYAYAQCRLTRRWYLGARYGSLRKSPHESDAGRTTLDDGASHRTTAQLAFVPSEFQSIRVEYSYVDSPQADWSEIFLQFNFTIGSHPAHRY